MVSRRIRNIFIIFVMLVMSNIYAEISGDYELISGYLKLQIFPSTGSFCLYAFSDEDRYVPLYDDRMKGSSNEFFVNYNDKIYQLRNRGKNSFFVKRDVDSIRVTHIYEDKFLVTQDYSFIEENPETGNALLKIETTIKNINEERADIGFKALIDTKLGERKERMFLTDVGRFFDSETILDPKYEKDTTLISRGNRIDCVFFLKHNQATVADKIFIANRNWLKTDLWKPKMIRGRSFNTRYSHNDSAVLFFWDTERKNFDEEFFVSMVIGYDRLVKDPVNKPKKTVPPAKTVKPIDPPVVVEPPKPVEPPKSVEPPKPVEEPKPIDEEKLRKAKYIKELLEKIGKTEENPDNYSIEELETLVNEVDGFVDTKEVPKTSDTEKVKPSEKITEGAKK